MSLNLPELARADYAKSVSMYNSALLFIFPTTNVFTLQDNQKSVLTGYHHAWTQRKKAEFFYLLLYVNSLVADFCCSFSYCRIFRIVYCNNVAFTLQDRAHLLKNKKQRKG